MTKIILPFIVLAGLLSGGSAVTDCQDLRNESDCMLTSGCYWGSAHDPRHPEEGYCISYDYDQEKQRWTTDSYVSLETDYDYDDEGAEVERIISDKEDLSAEYEYEEDELPNKAAHDSSSQPRNKYLRIRAVTPRNGSSGGRPSSSG
jgi:hypothetical protein